MVEEKRMMMKDYNWGKMTINKKNSGLEKEIDDERIIRLRKGIVGRLCLRKGDCL